MKQRQKLNYFKILKMKCCNVKDMDLRIMMLKKV